MKFIYLFMILSVSVAAGQLEQQQNLQGQRILRRVIKSTPTASNLGRVRLVAVRSVSASEKGAVSEITSKEAATFGQRSANETGPQQPSGGLKSKGASGQPGPLPAAAASTSTASSSTSSTSTSTTTTAVPTTSSTPEPASSAAPAGSKHRASERQQQAVEVELLSSAPSSWQTMSAVEAPAAMLIATGVRAPTASSSSSSSSSSDLSSSSSSNSEEYSSSSSSTGDFLRSNSVKGGVTRQQTTSARQQSFFYPQQQQQQRAASKTNNYQAATKTNWYQPPTTPRPAPIVQQQYEQQSEQYVEQQQEYGAAPQGQAEPFAFDFKTEDNSGNGQYRKEESDKNGVVRGSYGYTDANGIYRHVEYVADHNGFRANIKSNEPGLIGETQPASIQYAGGPAPAQTNGNNNNNNNNNQRYTGPSAADNGDWSSQGSSSSPVSEVALAPPDFESSHKSDRIRAPRNFRN